ncbi:hypothetical protein C0J52_05304 [Blattella germanica]|nr:hypothetical protein C0J52_05304 [Blattella germanica]
MGGGDLNLKKSWHPSTMRNMEKVWKAEQKHDQEKKRIAELQREIREEKAREDIQKYAEDKGVVEKKDNMKLDWMYKGPGGMVDREEYLLGRAIDKSFEQMQQAEKASTSSKNTIELDCLPNSIFSGGDEQVDMARKMQEDPLYIIKKKEIESRSQILKNPVKLKQLQELLKEHKSRKSKKHKKDKRKKNEKRQNRYHSDDSQEESGKDLDALLAAKYIKLKEKLHKTDIAKLKRRHNDSPDSDSDSDLKIRKSRNVKRRLSASPDSDSSANHKTNRNKKDTKISSSSRRRSSSESSSEDRKKMSSSKDKASKIKPTLEKELKRERSRSRSPVQRYVPKKPWVKPERKKLSEEELEQRRREMMNNAKWRETEREKNVARYRAQDEKEKKNDKGYNQDFLRKQLSYAASHGTVESRIKSNLNNIQRSGREMDKNFARR